MKDEGYGYYYPRPDKSTAVMLGLVYELNGKIDDVDVYPATDSRWNGANNTLFVNFLLIPGWLTGGSQ
ncbi:MAG TPA: hypothetical protein VEK15_09400 [Vicinamibacteria bacterium]|nr:hypothetical protein [Vicinamibacteria bacterium]